MHKKSNPIGLSICQNICVGERAQRKIGLSAMANQQIASSNQNPTEKTHTCIHWCALIDHLTLHFTLHFSAGMTPVFYTRGGFRSAFNVLPSPVP